MFNEFVVCFNDHAWIICFSNVQNNASMQTEVPFAPHHVGVTYAQHSAVDGSVHEEHVNRQYAGGSYSALQPEPTVKLNQSAVQYSTNQSANHLTKHSTNYSDNYLANQSTSQLTNQSTSQLANHSASQLANHSASHSQLSMQRYHCQPIRVFSLQNQNLLSRKGN